MTNAKDITLSEWMDLVGRARFSGALGIPRQNVHRAVKSGAMPSGWYVAVRDWCHANDVDVPEHLFAWSDIGFGPSQPPSQGSI